MKNLWMAFAAALLAGSICVVNPSAGSAAVFLAGDRPDPQHHAAPHRTTTLPKTADEQRLRTPSTAQAPITQKKHGRLKFRAS